MRRQVWKATIQAAIRAVSSVTTGPTSASIEVLLAQRLCDPFRVTESVPPICRVPVSKSPNMQTSTESTSMASAGVASAGIHGSLANRSNVSRRVSGSEPRQGTVKCIAAPLSPSDDVSGSAYRRAVEQPYIIAQYAKIRQAAKEFAQAASLPPTLQKTVSDQTKRNKLQAWDSRRATCDARIQCERTFSQADLAVTGRQSQALVLRGLQA